MSRANRQRYVPGSQILQVEASAGINVLIHQGRNDQPRDSNVKHIGYRLRWRSGGTVAITTPTVSDNGAAEFDVSVVGNEIVITWVGSALAALPLGTTTRTLTVTSTGASNSPMAIPVRITAA